MKSRKKEIERITKLYMKYLNGPLGKDVLKKLNEGESFSIHSNEQIMQVTKHSGKAIVEVFPRYNVDKPGDKFPT